MEVTPGWLISAAAVLVGAILLGVWSFQHADYGDMPVWRVIADQDLERAIRSSAGAALALLGFGLWRLFAMPATPKVAGDNDPDFDRVRAILGKAEWSQPDSNLALLGDKRFLFSPSGETFLMFGVRGRSWIAMDGPVGRTEERMELLWRFPRTCPTRSSWAFRSRRSARRPPCRWTASPWPVAGARSSAATGARPGRAARASRLSPPTAFRP
jgi:phosphatidylglycerol lysyltransferase